ncbi:MAG: hypothetical protein DRJ15_10080 [Bacteroidetes bacterium]|nr:MAG: hypothetical protein DRJ15_10080 [Bacteroidota bacterium]
MRIEEPQHKLPDEFGNDLEFLEVTPAKGDAYYDKEKDRAIIVYHHSIRIYFNRSKGRVDKTACNFSDYEEIRL